MTKPLIIIIQNVVPHYRIDFFNSLCNISDIVLIHSGHISNPGKVRYKEFIIPSYKVGPLIIQVGIFKLIKQIKPTAVIASADIRNVMSIAAMYSYDQHLKWVWWGLDIGASHIATLIKHRVCKRNNPVIFYNETVMNKFISFGLKKEKLFVANNTFHVQDSISLANEFPKDIFLNVGTLDARKQNDILIIAFSKIVDASNIKLILIGDGAEKQKILDLVNFLNLNDRVFILGKIEDPNILKNYYKRAIASISFGQAGLAVLQSMAYGVPFVTKQNAITGGEKFNIIHEYNGILCSDNTEALVATMNKLIQNHRFAKKLGNSAFIHYRDNANIDVMVRAFYLALNYFK